MKEHIDEGKMKLRAAVCAGAKARGLDDVPRREARLEELSRLDWELSQIEGVGRVDDFLCAKEIVDVIRGAGGIVAPGRGAAVSSLVCYVLRITDVDPMMHDLLFERFVMGANQILIDTDRVGFEAVQRWQGACGMKERGAVVVEHDSCLDLVWKVYHCLEMEGVARPNWRRDHLTELETREVFGSGACGDIGGFEGERVGRMLRSFGAHTFEEIRDVYALSWVGSEAAYSYIGRKVCGDEDGDYIHPLLKRVTSGTLGHFIYEEQVFSFLRLAAGFTRNEAYKGMKAFLRKDEEKCRGFEEKFVAGCLGNGEFRVGRFEEEEVARGAAVLLWGVLKKEGWTTMMKAHCVGKTELAMRIGYLKVKYPEEWERAKLM